MSHILRIRIFTDFTLTYIIVDGREQKEEGLW